MKKAWLVLLLSLNVSSAFALSSRIAQIIPGPEGRNQYFPRFSSITIGDLGSGIKVLDEGTLQGGATWFNFVGSGVTAACVGGTCTITINGGGAGGGGGGSVFVYNGTNNTSISTFAILGAQVAFDGSLSSFTIIPTAKFWVSTQASFNFFAGIASTASAVMNISLTSAAFNVLNATAGTSISAALLTGSTGGVLVSGLLTWTSTATGRIDNLQLWLSTANSQILALHGSTASIKTEFRNFGSTSGVLMAGVLNALSTTSVSIDQGQVFQSTVASYLTNGALAVYSGGVFKGNATTINFTNAISATCPSSTCTATATAGGGGGSSSLAVGTGTATNTTVISSPSAILAFNPGPFVISLIGGATAQVEVNYSSVTLFGSSVVVQSIYYLHNSTSDNNILASLLTGSTGGILISGILTALSTTSAVENISLSSAAFYTHNSSNDLILANINSATTTLSLSTTLIVNQESSDISNRTYFLHDESTGPSSVYRLLGSSPSALAETSRTSNVVIGGGMVSISSFITTSGDPNVRKVRAGVWSFTTWAQAASILSASNIVITVSTIGVDGTQIQEIFSSTSTNFLDTNVDRFDTVGLQVNDVIMSTSDRFLIQYFGKSVSGVGINLTLYYAGSSRFSHVSSPLGSVNTFTQLTDTPQTLIGQKKKYLTVNDEENATVFVTTITDAFNTYTSSNDTQQTKYVNFLSTAGTSMAAALLTGSTGGVLTANLLTWTSSSTVSIDKKLQDIVNVIRSSHIAPNPTFVGGITAASGTITSSLNVMDVVTSSIGFIAPSSTIPYINSSIRIDVSSLAVTGGTVTFNGVPWIFGHVNPTNGQIPKYNSTNNLIEWNTDNTGGGGGSGDNLGSGISTVPINALTGGITMSSGMALSSFTAGGEITSTTGFIGNSSTMNYVFAGTSTLNTVAITSGVASGFTVGNSTIGQLMLGLGSVGAPSLTFSGSPGGASRTTGIYGNANNEIRVTANGTQVLAISGAAIKGANGTTAAPFYSFSNAGGYGMSLAPDNISLLLSANGLFRAGMINGGLVLGSLKNPRSSVLITSASVNSGGNQIANQTLLLVDSDTQKFEVTGTSISEWVPSTNFSSATAWGGFTSTSGFLGGGSTFTELAVSGGTLAFNNQGFRIVFASAPDTSAGKQYLIWTQQANGAYLIGSANTPAGSVGGGGGGGSGFWARTNGGFQAVSSMTLSGSRFNSITSDGSGSSTMTVGASTNSYSVKFIPAQAMLGRPGQFSAGDFAGGMAISTNPANGNDGDDHITLAHFSFAPSTRQFVFWQTNFSSNEWMVNSTFSWSYSAFVSSAGGAGKEVDFALQAYCTGGQPNLQTAVYGTSVAVALPNMASNWTVYNSTISTSLTPGGTCFGGSPILWRLSRSAQDNSDTLGGATGSFANIVGVNIWVRDSDMAQRDKYAR